MESLRSMRSRQRSWIAQMLAMRIVEGMCARKTLMVGIVKAGVRRGRISMLLEAQEDKIKEDHKEKGQEKQKKQQEEQEDEDQETKVD
jgi:hypothetical protein